MRISVCLSVCMYVCHMRTWCLWKLGEEVRSPKLELVSARDQVLFTAEPSVQSPKVGF